MRTQYSRLLKPKPSGSGDAIPTAKQIWLLKNMEFLKKHMMPRHTETSELLKEDEKYPNEMSDQEDCMSDGSDQEARPLQKRSGNAQTDTYKEKCAFPITKAQPKKRRQSEDIEIQKLSWSLQGAPLTASKACSPSSSSSSSATSSSCSSSRAMMSPTQRQMLWRMHRLL